MNMTVNAKSAMARRETLLVVNSVTLGNLLQAEKLEKKLTVQFLRSKLY